MDIYDYDLARSFGITTGAMITDILVPFPKGCDRLRQIGNTGYMKQDLYWNLYKGNQLPTSLRMIIS